MLLSHIRRCFDARVLAIHPKTHLVRAFIDHNIATKLHGLRATIPRRIPAAVLQHHWDMCCLENTPSSVISSGVLSNIPELPLPAAKVRRVFHGHPYKEDFNTQASGTQASSGAPASDTRVLQPNPYQATAKPHSPPLSELDSAERALWPSGKGSIRGPGTAQELDADVGSLEEINSDEEYGRGRSRQKRRCLATEEDDTRMIAMSQVKMACMARRGRGSSHHRIAPSTLVRSTLRGAV